MNGPHILDSHFWIYNIKSWISKNQRTKTNKTGKKERKKERQATWFFETLREMCPYSEFFWSVFSSIRTGFHVVKMFSKRTKTTEQLKQYSWNLKLTKCLIHNVSVWCLQQTFFTIVTPLCLYNPGNPITSLFLTLTIT